MSLKSKFISASIMLSMASLAFASADTTTSSAPAAQPTPMVAPAPTPPDSVPQAPSAAEAPAAISAPVPAAPQAVAPIPEAPIAPAAPQADVSAAIIPLVIQEEYIPKPDYEMLDKLVNALSNNNYEDFSKHFDEAVAIFWPHGMISYGPVTAATSWQHMFENYKLTGLKFNSAHDAIISITKNIAIVNGKISVLMGTKNATLTASVTMKYDNNAWKIVSMAFFSPDLEHIKIERLAEETKSNMPYIITLAIGFVIGAALVAFFRRRHNV